MTSTRTYREMMTKEEAVKELVANAGVTFDAGIVETFITKVVDKL